jgi:hypothetical protein
VEATFLTLESDVARVAGSARLGARHRLPCPRARLARSSGEQDHALHRLQPDPAAVQRRRALLREVSEKSTQVIEYLRSAGRIIALSLGFSGWRDTLTAALAARLGGFFFPGRHLAERGPDTIIELLFIQERANRDRRISADLLRRKGVIPRREWHPEQSKDINIAACRGMFCGVVS